MLTVEQLNLGIVGACGRGAGFKTACDALGTVRVHAVCDIDTAGLPQAAAALGAEEQYADYGEMLAASDIDAVIIATPMQHHVEQSIAALERGIHVLSEVPAGVSVEECQRLVAACEASDAVYMMAENYTYRKPNVMIREIASRGLFGELYYAEGEYLHEVKALNERTPWRRVWQTGIDGVTYGTHSLGPVLQWMREDRVESVCCAGSGRHHVDPRGERYHQDSNVMLCKMARGGLVKIRVDMLSDRPHAMTNYQLQGTDGCYESARALGEPHRIWLRSERAEHDRWQNLEELEEKYLPERWREAGVDARSAGHGGGDYFEILDFVDAALGRHSPDIGIHEAMDMTLPGLVSQKSIADGGAWLPVPDSREWGLLQSV